MIQIIENRFRLIRIWKQIEKLAYLPTETEIEKVNNIVREKGMNFYRDYIKKLLTAYKYALCHTHYKTGRNMIDDICQGRKIYIKSYVKNNNVQGI